MFPWQRWKGDVKDAFSVLVLWHRVLKKIESEHGIAVLTYFAFVRYFIEVRELIEFISRGKLFHFKMRSRISIRGYVRPSVGPSIGPSVRWSVRPSVRRLVRPSVRRSVDHTRVEFLETPIFRLK